MCIYIYITILQYSHTSICMYTILYPEPGASCHTDPSDPSDPSSPGASWGHMGMGPEVNAQRTDGVTALSS